MVKLKVVEVFESIQGEVPLGKYALFIRLFGCNRRCTFCDTKYSWKNHTFYELDVNDLYIPKSINYVVFTGGEPLLQKSNLELFVIKLKQKYPQLKIALETNGDETKFKWNLFNVIVVSPKDMYTLEYWVKQLDKFDNLFLKVVDKPDDEQLCYYLRRLLDHGILLPEHLERIYIMPFGTTKQQIDENLKLILKRIDKYNLKGVNIAYRLHITLNMK